MKIQVTKLDIERGVGSDPRHCAVARAVRRVTGYQKAVESGLGFICIAQTMYRTPLAVSRFIEDFDNGESVQPFEFKLTNPWIKWG